MHRIKLDVTIRKMSQIEFQDTGNLQQITACFAGQILIPNSDEIFIEICAIKKRSSIESKVTEKLQKFAKILGNVAIFSTNLSQHVEP